MTKTRKRGGSTSILYFKTIPFQQTPIFRLYINLVALLRPTSIQGINVGRKMGTHLSNIFGQAGFETGVYEALRKEAMRDIEGQMKEHDIKRISSFRIEYIETPSHVIANCYGTALKLA